MESRGLKLSNDTLKFKLVKLEESHNIDEHKVNVHLGRGEYSPQFHLTEAANLMINS